MNINTKSWHYQLMNRYGAHRGWVESTYTDSCEYIRGVMWMISILSAMTLVAGVVLGITIGDFFAWVIACITTGGFIDIGPGAFMTAFFGVALLGFYMCTRVANHINHMRAVAVQANSEAKPPVERQPGFVRVAYIQFKNKYCSRVTYI